MRRSNDDTNPGFFASDAEPSSVLPGSRGLWHSQKQSLQGEAGGADDPDAPARHTILIVDDEPDIVHSLADVLSHQMEGLRILTANNADEGLAQLREEPVDVIISDYRLPGMNGLEFLRASESLAPSASRILISAYLIGIPIGGPNSRIVGQFLSKPLDVQPLLAAVRKALEESPTFAV